MQYGGIEENVIMDNKRIQESLTVAEVGQILRIGSNKAYNLVRSGVFPVTKIGHTYHIPAKTFFAWFDGTPPSYVDTNAAKP